MRMVFFALAILLRPSPARGDWAWHQTISPHFVVSHQSAWTPPGFVLNLERMHNRLRMDLSMFSPWMAKERLKLYLYENQKSYLDGEFKPPAWSNGLSIYSDKAVVVYDQADRKKLHEVISHETTHLLFNGYWGEHNKKSPAWLNEGLAMMEEAENAAVPEKSDWYRAMAYLSADSLLPMGEFFETAPIDDLKDDKDKVNLWYTQAYSVVYFLYRQHTRIQFKNFCVRLRDGRELEETIRVVYHYPRLTAFEKAWKAWALNSVHRHRVEKLATAADAEPEKKTPGRLEPRGFKSLRQ